MEPSHPSGAQPNVVLLGCADDERELVLAFRRLGARVRVFSDVQRAATALSAPDVTGDRILVLGAAASDFDPNTMPADANIYPNPRVMDLAGDRAGMRSLASKELGVPVIPGKFARSAGELEVVAEQLGYPVVIRSAEVWPGEPQWTATEPADIPEVHHFPVLVERLVRRDLEVTMLVVRSVDPATGEDATWFCEPIGCTHRGGSLSEMWQPAQLSDAALDNARSVAARVVGGLGKTDATAARGVWNVQLLVAGDDVYFSGVSVRLQPTGIVTIATQRLSQYELHARAILGLPVDATLTSPGAAQTIVASADRSATAAGRALAVPEAQLHLFGRGGVALVTAETVEEARERVAQAVGALH